jgi:adsorption protein B
MFEFVLAEYIYILDVVAVIVTLAILGSSLDDLFIDVYFWVREVYRWAVIRSRFQPLRVEDLRKEEEHWFAVMVPAWKEYDVIAKMVEATLATVEYKKYVIFIGTYQNDLETTAEADRMARRFPQMVKRATVLNDGPTCKADCLNWIVQSIGLYEEQNKMRFSGVIMHDCEDVIHPLEMRLFNHLIDRMDLIQLPVLSLEREWHEFVAGTYLDDFSEWHCKEMVVRESMTGIVPGSGVATCYGRRAIDELAKRNNNMPFNTDTLTEDYEMSHRLKKVGTNQIFVRFPVMYTAKRRSLFTRREKLVDVKSLIATREYFPSGFRAAYRQRARWVLGVAFQGWEQMGWQGGLVSKYLYFRDRKGVVTSFVGLLAYFVAFNLLVLWGLKEAGFDFIRYPEIVQPDGIMFQILMINFVLFLNRIMQRVYFVTKLNGLEQGLLAIPRMVVSNVINFFAVCRAWKIFIIYFITGKRIAWDKTQHVYPSMDELRHQRVKMGELLLSWQAIDEQALHQALEHQKQTGMKLGAQLLKSGLVSEEMLADALSEQSGLPRSHLKLDAVGRFSGRLPRYLVMQYRVVPFADGEEGALNLAVSEPPSQEVRDEISRQVSDRVGFFIVSEREMEEAIDWYTLGTATHQPSARTDRRLLGDILLGMHALTVGEMAETLRTYDSTKHGRIGTFLLERGAITRGQLEEALRIQRADVNEADVVPAGAEWRLA